MKLGIQTGIFYDRDITGVLPAIREAGFDIVEIWAGCQRTGEYVHFDWHEQQKVHEVAALLRSLGLTVSSLHAPFSDTLDLSHPNEMHRRFAVNETLRTLEVLSYLGGDILVVHPASNDFSLRDRAGHYGPSRKSIEELAVAVKEYGVKLAVENQLPHILGGDIPTLHSLIAGLPETDVGFCFDTSHANLYHGHRVENYLSQLGKRVLTLHVSDNYGNRDDHYIVGDGHVNWPAFIDMLRRNDYQGVFMLEVVAEVNQRDKYLTLKSGYQRARQLLAQ